jgi:hypothetical protein
VVSIGDRRLRKEWEGRWGDFEALRDGKLFGFGWEYGE